MRFTTLLLAICIFLKLNVNLVNMAWHKGISLLTLQVYELCYRRAQFESATLRSC